MYFALPSLTFYPVRPETSSSFSTSRFLLRRSTASASARQSILLVNNVPRVDIDIPSDSFKSECEQKQVKVCLPVGGSATFLIYSV